MANDSTYSVDDINGIEKRFDHVYSVTDDRGNIESNRMQIELHTNMSVCLMVLHCAYEIEFLKYHRICTTRAHK